MLSVSIGTLHETHLSVPGEIWNVNPQLCMIANAWGGVCAHPAAHR